MGGKKQEVICMAEVLESEAQNARTPRDHLTASNVRQQYRYKEVDTFNTRAAQ